MSKMQHNKCPICGNNLIDFGKGIKCEKNDNGNGCGFILWKNSFGHDFNVEEFDKLLNNERIIIDCKSKEGKPYKREIYMDDNWGITWDEPFIPTERKDGFV